MLGNDVVDLADPEARAEALHPRFDRRVLAPAEQAWLRASRHPELDRWVLWAAKESTYKAARRIDPSVVFSPSRFGARLEPVASGFAGRVRHGDRDFSVRVDVGSRFVHAVSRAEPASATAPLSALCVVPGEGALAPRSASAAVRALARRTLAGALDVAPSALDFGRSAGLPFLRVGGRERRSVLSFSHHGRCAAFAVAFS